MTRTAGALYVPPLKKKRHHRTLHKQKQLFLSLEWQNDKTVMKSISFLLVISHHQHHQEINQDLGFSVNRHDQWPENTNTFWEVYGKMISKWPCLSKSPWQGQEQLNTLGRWVPNSPITVLQPEIRPPSATKALRIAQANVDSLPPFQVHLRSLFSSTEIEHLYVKRHRPVPMLQWNVSFMVMHNEYLKIALQAILCYWCFSFCIAALFR